MDQKKPNPIDVHVGARIRLRRTMMRMSQEKLGAGLGITFQQVQKYEKGSNRVGASRLQQIAIILNVPVSYFFAEAPDGSPLSDRRPFLPEEEAVSAFLATREGLELNRAFQRVADAKLRQNILQLVTSLGRTSEPEHDQADSGVAR
ncbi:helix-turn-helix domain-containing protein [Rhizobium sp. P32RR-XVIII]|uniref:helix-turn-helix domain-containing protein n=1 Tax=Rhizobium sp. P32RR-XVIII TaxID=2726738 RepID=UPI001456FFAC|nr:helix-turn-helix domain-containing protein [Rhizobium sp. P32RR-XVIII]NLS06321.1 helix-turn-helix domain-containing protein [Rhizobium sp. P32RR-XVIII]